MKHPVRRKTSAAEGLAYFGLIFRVPRCPKAGQVVEVIIPSDLLSLLPPKQVVVEAETLVAAIKPSQKDALLHDVAMLLSFVHREKVPALYQKRWFSQANVRLLNERLAEPEELSGVRSELQSTRVRFVHFLAESAGLMDVVGSSRSSVRPHFAPTPQGWLTSWEEIVTQMTQIYMIYLINKF